MRMRRFSFAAALAAAVSLTAAGGAVPAGTPTQLRVDESPVQPATIAFVYASLSLANGAAATAQVTWYVPPRYSLDLTLAPGVKLGTGAIKFTGGSGDLSGQGNLTTDDPAAHQADPCAPGPHAAVWLLTTQLAGQPFVLPLYVDPAPPAVAAKAAFRIQACFDPPATSGGALAGLDLHITRGITNPATPGSYVWRALVTPYGPAGVLNPNATTESQSLVPLPHAVTIKTRYDPIRKRITVSGVAIAGRGRDTLAPVSIQVTTDLNQGRLKQLGLVRTDSHGAYTFTHAFAKTAYVIVEVPDSAYGTDCEDPIGPSPCTYETVAASDPARRKVLVPAAG